MVGLGTIVNVIAVVIGGAAGLILKKVLPDHLKETVMHGLGLAVVIIGLSGIFSAIFTVEEGILSAKYTLLMIISLAVGAVIGELIDIEAKLEALAEKCQRIFSSHGESSTFSQGFVTATLVFCIGAMAIVGAIEDGINGNTDILFAKSFIDSVAAMIFASTMGAGVIFSALAVGVYQGAITLLAVFISPYLNSEVVTQISLMGSILILGIGFNMLKITKIKIGNLLPAIFIPIVYFIIRCFI